MFEMSKFRAAYKPPRKVDTYDDVSSDMDIFQRSEEQFLPPGKTFEDLTPEEERRVKHQYRYDYYKPGVYQAITWIRNNNNHGL